MAKEIKVIGTTPIDIATRKKSLEAINSLPTKALKNIASLVGSDKAVDHLTSDTKFKTLKMFL